jgi:hypothetical protein
MWQVNEIGNNIDSEKETKDIKSNDDHLTNFLKKIRASTESRESCCRRASRILPASEKTLSDVVELAGTHNNASARRESLEEKIKHFFKLHIRNREDRKKMNCNLIKNLTWERSLIFLSTTLIYTHYYWSITSFYSIRRLRRNHRYHPNSCRYRTIGEYWLHWILYAVSLFFSSSSSYSPIHNHLL